MRYYNQELETLPRDRLQAYQLERLSKLLTEIEGKNAFYTRRLRAVGARPGDFKSLNDLKRLPFTTKEELLADQAAHPPFGTNLTYPESRYTRYHQTSGTTGTPLRVPDTADSWNLWGRCWGYVFAGVGLTAEDRLFIAFGFGPFIGFWAAVEGAREIGAMMIPGGGRDSLQRLQLMQDTGCTALCSTPTYALRLAEVAAQHDLDLRSWPVRLTVHGGEPGANVPATKRRIEQAWNAKCYDHAGGTEVGAYSFECQAQPGGTHVIETEFIVEVVDPNTGKDRGAGQEGELVLTNLGRFGYPVIRYRTGDVVKLEQQTCDCDRTFVRCQGGVIGRRDDMLTVQGVNIYPSAIENLVRACAEVIEFRVTVARERALDEMLIEIECSSPDGTTACERVSNSIKHATGLRPRVVLAGPDGLPRFELKAHRFHVKQ